MQQEIALSSARFRVVVCGRRWGKTRVGAYLALRSVVRGERVWWVAPVYSQAMLAWRLLRPLFAQLPSVEIRESERSVKLGKGELWIKSADNRDNLRGEGLDGVVIDECDYTQEETWTQALRPALADRKGWALFISTPREIGGWFQKAYQRGQEQRDGWASWSYPSWSNPFLDPAEIETAKLDMSELEFRQEFGAEFVGKPDSVYHNFDMSLHVKPTAYNPSLPVLVGLDFNNTPRVAVFVQVLPGEVFAAIGEIHHATQATTGEHAEMVKSWLVARRIPLSAVSCIPDASGMALRHDGGRDHDDFRRAGFKIDCPQANPHIHERDAAVLAYLKNAQGVARTQIDPSCRHLIESFTKFKQQRRGASPWGHILDAWGYVVHRKSGRKASATVQIQGFG